MCLFISYNYISAPGKFFIIIVVFCWSVITTQDSNISIENNLVWFLLGTENVDPAMFNLIACFVFGPARWGRKQEGGKDESSCPIFRNRFANLSPCTGNLKRFFNYYFQVTSYWFLEAMSKWLFHACRSALEQWVQAAIDFRINSESNPSYMS